MNKLVLVGLSAVTLTCSASATIYSVDWAGGGAITQNYVGNINWGHTLYRSGLNFSLTGWSENGHTGNIAVGIYAFAAGPNINQQNSEIDVLCVQLDAWSHNGDYSTRGLSGYAGWLAGQIAVVQGIGNANERLDKAAALALATWEINYDSKDYAGVGAAGLNFSTGDFKYTTSGSILNYANDYLAAYDRDNTDRMYRYYHNPIPGSTTDYQDYIGTGPGEQGQPSVPGPAAIIPFAIGLVASLKRKRK